MKKILIKTMASVFSITIFASSLYGFGVEEKTGDTSSFQIVGSYNLSEPKYFSDERNFTNEFYDHSTDMKNSYALGLRATQGYEFFFTQTQGLRLYFDVGVMYFSENKFTDDSHFPYYLGSLSTYHYYDKKIALWLDLGLNLDYRIDFYQGKNSSYGAFAGVGYGYGIYSEKVAYGLTPNNYSYSHSKTLLGGGVNLQAGVLTTTKTGWQFELGVLYKYRDFYAYVKPDAISSPIKKYFPISNLGGYLSIGKKY